MNRLTLAEAADLVEKLLSGEIPTVTVETLYQIVDAYRRSRTPLSLPAIAILNRVLSKHDVDGQKLRIEQYQQRVRFMVTIS